MTKSKQKHYKYLVRQNNSIVTTVEYDGLQIRMVGYHTKKNKPIIGKFPFDEACKIALWLLTSQRYVSIVAPGPYNEPMEYGIKIERVK